MKILLLTVIIMVSQLCFGQSDTMPKHQIEKFDFKIGHWKWKAKGLTKPNDPKIYNGTGFSHIYFANDSTAIIDDHKIEWENGVSYKAITYRTYDTISNKYLVVWAQAKSSNTAKIEGYWEGTKFIEIEKGADKFGEWTNRMEIYDIGNNYHKAKLIRTYKNGYSLTILEYEATRLIKNDIQTIDKKQ